MTSSQTKPLLTYRPIEGLMWVNNSNVLLIVNERTSISHLLQGAEAALWRWLHQDHDYDQVVSLFSALLSIPSSEGEVRVINMLQDWGSLGLLEVAYG